MWIRTVAMWWIKMLPKHQARAKSEKCQAKIYPAHPHTTQKIRQIRRQCRNSIIHYSSLRIRMTLMVCFNVWKKTWKKRKVYSPAENWTKYTHFYVLQPNNWARKKWLTRRFKCHDWNLCNRKRCNFGNSIRNKENQKKINKKQNITHKQTNTQRKNIHLIAFNCFSFCRIVKHNSCLINEVKMNHI